MSTGVKAIVALTMVLLVAAFVSSAGRVLFIAAIGGLVVFLGLWIEHDANKEEKGEYLSNFTEDARRPRLKAKWGFWILMVGIGIEIGVAGWEAIRTEIEMRHIKAEIAKNDPMKQPIRTASAIVSLQIGATQAPLGKTSSNLYVNALSLSFGRKMNLDAKDFDAWGSIKEGWYCYMECRWSLTHPAVIGHPDMTLEEFISEANHFEIHPFFIWGDTRVVKGQILLTLNSTQWKIPIPQQDRRMLEGLEIEGSFNLTNATKMTK
jgi:hypothetical protein